PCAPSPLICSATRIRIRTPPARKTRFPWDKGSEEKCSGLTDNDPRACCPALPRCRQYTPSNLGTSLRGRFNWICVVLSGRTDKTQVDYGEPKLESDPQDGIIENH